ncbi:MAG TPA: IclR family transcriptional regulator [Candidatus Micrarchaeaceae archaeon]|nr:IclR family transcriptional regulator [Candidatus Micrarchaeaceae archaeon]
MKNGKANYAEHSRALERAITILDLFTFESPTWTVSRIAQASDRSLAATHRAVAALESAGYLERKADRGPLQLGLRLLQLGAIVSRRLDIAQAAADPLRRLVEELGDTATLLVPQEGGALCVARVEGSFPIRPHAVVVGERMAYHTGAMPLAIFAFLGEAERSAYLKRPLVRLTERTLTRPADIKRRAAEIRESGISLSFAEAVAGTAAAAAPIFGVDGTIAGAVGVTGIEARFERERQPLIIQALAAAAGGVSRQIGNQQPDLRPVAEH